jgi:hypothetical protein
MVSGELEKLLKRYITPDIIVKAGVLENAKRAEGGTPVAEYAASCLEASERLRVR